MNDKYLCKPSSAIICDCFIHCHCASVCRQSNTINMDSTSLEYSQFEIKGNDKLQMNSTCLDDDMVLRCETTTISNELASAENRPTSERESSPPPPPPTTRCGSCCSANVAVAFCNECGVFICNQCHIAHKRMKCFEHHQVCELAMRPIISKRNCMSHPSRVALFFCWTCEELICSLCTPNTHADHRMASYDDAQQSMRTSMGKYIGEFNALLSKQMEAAKNVAVRLERADTLNLQLKHDYSKILNALNNIRDRASAKIQQYTAKLKEAATQADENINNMRHWIEQMENMIESFDIEQYLAMKSKIVKELGQMDVIDTLSATIQLDERLANVPQIIRKLFDDLDIRETHDAENCLLTGVKLSIASNTEPSPMAPISIETIRSISSIYLSPIDPNIISLSRNTMSIESAELNCQKAATDDELSILHKRTDSDAADAPLLIL